MPSSKKEATKVNEEAMRPVGASANPATSWVGTGLQVKGEVSGTEDLVIDGWVEGLVQLDDRNLTVGTTANVEADVIAGEVVIYSKLKGNIRAASRIEIKKRKRGARLSLIKGLIAEIDFEVRPLSKMV